MRRSSLHVVQIFLFVFIIALGWLCVGCANSSSSEAFENAKETKDLLENTADCVVVVDDRTHLTAYDITGRPKTLLRYGNVGGHWTTGHAVAGPDDRGRIVVVTEQGDDSTALQHCLLVTDVGGAQPVELFCRNGSVREHLIGEHLALSRTGKVAFISRCYSTQLTDALLTSGRIEVWDLDTKEGLALDNVAQDEPMSWFPDGERLVYSKLVRRATLPENAPGLDRFIPYYSRRTHQLSTVWSLNIVTGEEVLLYVGSVGIVSRDGKSLFVGGYKGVDFEYVCLDLDLQSTKLVSFPSRDVLLIGALTSDFCLYMGLPTRGAPLKFTKNNSPLRGPKQMLAIKALELSTQRVETIVPYVDPRSAISFGTGFVNKQ